MRIVFDRGTLLLEEVPPGLVLDDIPGVLWDPRVHAYRAPARFFYALLAELRRRGVPLPDRPLPKLAPPTGFRPVSLRPYQEAALAAWRRAGRRGVVVLPTGSGKTRVALAAMARTATPALCLVPTRALLDQWVEAILEIYDGAVGRYGDGERTLGPITVATYASGYRHMARLGDHFGLLVVDEAHHFGRGWRDEALEMSIAPLRLGLTATPAPAKDENNRAAFLLGPVVFELEVGDLPGFLAPLDRVTCRLRLDRDERDEYDRLCELYRGAYRAFLGNHLGADWEDFLRHAAHTDEGRRGIAAWRRARRLLAYPRSKQNALAVLLSRHRAERTLVFVADNETAYAVAREHLIMPLTCEVSPRERQEVLAGFRSGRLRALVSAQVLNEGLDVPDADVGIIVAGRLGEREYVQRVGRLLRPRPDKRALLYELVVEQSNEAWLAARRGQRHAGRGRSAA